MVLFIIVCMVIGIVGYFVGYFVGYGEGRDSVPNNAAWLAAEKYNAATGFMESLNACLSSVVGSLQAVGDQLSTAHKKEE